MTIFIDLTPEAAFKRKHGADENDRLEKAGLEFHKRVYEGYKAVAEAEEKCEDISARAIFDAVASETADAAMDSLVRTAARNLLAQGLSMDAKRYSPGYGDMPLEMQKIFFSQLHLEELKMVLNDNFYMIPEKSVTAFAAVRKIVE